MYVLLYRLFLRVCPAEFRASYGEAALDAFSQTIDSVPQGARVFVALRAYADLVFTAIMEWTGDIARDVSFALRLIGRSPMHSAVVIATLGIAIGILCAVMSVVNAVLLAPLPYADASRLVFIEDRSARDPASPGNQTSLQNSEDWRTLTTGSFSDIGSFAGTLFTRTGINVPEAIHGAVVTGAFLQTLGVRASLGRLIDDADTAPGARPVVVISNAYWRRDFNASSDVVGKVLQLNGKAFAIAGVLPADFILPRADALSGEQFDIIRPLLRNASARNSHYLDTFGRLAPGVSLAQAQADLNRAAAILRQRYPLDNYDIGERAIDLRTHLFSDARAMLTIALLAAISVLVIACLNIGNMFLVRAGSRQREMAVRFAVGASRERMVRQLLIEAFTYSFAGGACGVVLSALLLATLSRVDLSVLPHASSAVLDARVLLGAFVAIVACALLTGIAPALTLSQRTVGTIIKSAGRGVSDSRGKVVRAACVVVELAIAIALVTASGLLIRSSLALQRVDVGFASGELAASKYIMLSAPRYRDNNSIVAFARDLEERLHAMPGLNVSGVTYTTPLTHVNSDSESLSIVGRPQSPGTPDVVVRYNAMSTAALEAFRFKLLHGRQFTTRDREQTQPVAVVTRAFERRFFGEASALGRRIRIGFGDAPPVRTIVGVIDDFKGDELTEAAAPYVIVPFEQDPSREFQVIVRSTLDSAQLSQSVSAAVRTVDPSLPPTSVSTYVTFLAARRAPTSTVLSLVGIMAFVALLLSAIGTYGVLAYNVARRRTEFAIRRTIGASARSILTIVLRETAIYAVAGVLLGFVLAVPLTGGIVPLLYGVDRFDGVTFTFVAAVLLTVAFLASLPPAITALRADPAAALRYE